MPFASALMALFPAPPRLAQATPTAPGTEHAGVAPGLTAEAKQAMISSLQLDITERARRLRQQYNEQAQQLRTRLERRINRLPPKMRMRTMGDLADEHVRKTVAETQAETTGQREKSKSSMKRSSEHAFGGDSEDKENQDRSEPARLDNQKKRVRLTKPQTLPLSAKKPPIPPRNNAGILSPRSHKSRTLPLSPVKYSSPEKTRPVSSMAKPRLAPKPAATRAPSRAVVRPHTASRRRILANKVESESEGRESESSATSAVTTIIKKSATTKSKAVTERRAPTKPAASSTRKRAPAVKEKEGVSTRSLRSRA